METHVHRWRIETQAVKGRYPAACACGATAKYPVEPKLMGGGTFRLKGSLRREKRIHFGTHFEDELAR